jgi:hypothetical protein
MPEDAVMEAPEVSEPEAEPVEGEIEEPAAEPEVEVEPTEEVEGEEVAEEEGEQEVAGQDGRKMPDGLKKALAELKTAGKGDVAKQIKGLFYAEQEYRAMFPTPADAATVKATLDEIGGPEGIKEIQQERQEWLALDQQFAEGKPDFAKSLAQSSPEALVKNAPHVLNEWASLAPEQYQYFANSVAANTIMSQPGVEASLTQLAHLHGQLADTPWAQQAIANVVNGILGLKDKTAQYEQKRVDPREQQLKQRETEFEQRRRADFEGGVADKAEKYLAEKMQPELKRVIGTRTVDPEAMKGYERMVNDEVMRRLGEVPGFEEMLEANYRTGNADKSLAYIQQQYNKILPEAVKVIAPYLRNIAPGKPAPKAAATGATGKPATPGHVTLREMPSWDQVDRNKTTVADMMMGKAVLTNGKTASGWA